VVRLLADEKVPWQAFANGNEVTERVSRVTFAKPSIHIGVIDLSMTRLR
jgi:hypothetical protein